MSTQILVVDDDPVIRTLVSEYLGAYGFEIQTAESGEQCLKSLSDGLPDIVILDLQMPIMNGIEVLERIRANNLTGAVPVILLSANAQNETASMVEKYKIKADHYLEKPFEIKSILEAIHSVQQLKTV